VYVVMRMKVRARVVWEFWDMKIAIRTKKIFMKSGKYWGFVNIGFSFFVIFAQRIPRGIARIRRRYCIISFLRRVGF